MSYSHGELVQLAEEGRRKNRMLRLIEAEELKHILNNSKYYGTEAGNAFADMITECKTIGGRKKGRWIKNDFYEDALMCSCCNAYLDKEDWGRHYFYFCYHCGAFMEGMDTGEEKQDE